MAARNKPAAQKTAMNTWRPVSRRIWSRATDVMSPTAPSQRPANTIQTTTARIGLVPFTTRVLMS